MKVILSLLKIQLLAILYLLLLNPVFAQNVRKPDILFLRNDTKLEVRIQEVDDTVVKYKKLSDDEGPLFTVKKSEISSIQYGNGEVKTFEAVLEVPSYYAPGQSAPQARPAAPLQAPGSRNQFLEEIRASSADNLRATYKYYKGKSKTGLVMGIAGTSVGMILSGVGAGIIAGSMDANGNFASYADEQRAIRGAWLMLGGLAGAATFGTVGFIKAGKNGSKAGKIRRELIHRGEPIAFRISPGFNPATQAGYLTLNIRF
ncbi:hypothetical protein [Dyadobacter sp. CY343]|uniref:hypothetical protein n=1 Tax=Dyadobacter sp. CY343 TaxID=2907299 RepID=UPI001F1E8B14|nr:hypothetical protein [Dyadobacter sp. CY343]MCE7063089.1 hypothetical protein [Dyadobacter sp. CY343]